jgi:hypothetical protein
LKFIKIINIVFLVGDMAEGVGREAFDDALRKRIADTTKVD